MKKIILPLLLATTFSYAGTNTENASSEIAEYLDLDLTENSKSVLYQGTLKEISTTPNAGSGGVADYLNGRKVKCYMEITKRNYSIKDLSVYTVEEKFSKVNWSDVTLSENSIRTSLSLFGGDLKISDSVSTETDRPDFRGGGTNYHTTKNTLRLSMKDQRISRLEFGQSRTATEVWNLVPVPMSSSRKDSGVCVDLIRVSKKI